MPAVESRDILTMPPAKRKTSPLTLALMLVGALLVVKVAVLVLTVRYASWQFLLGESLGSGVLGLVVIAVAIFRYASAIAARLERYEYLDDRLSSGLLLLLAGVLLLVPGLLTELLGLALLLPRTRLAVLVWLRRRFSVPPVYAEPPARILPGSRADGSEGGEDDQPARLSVPAKRRAA
jgi:UPF0716 protein FxsA